MIFKAEISVGEGEDDEVELSAPVCSPFVLVLLHHCSLSAPPRSPHDGLHPESHHRPRAQRDPRAVGPQQGQGEARGERPQLLLDLRYRPQQLVGTLRLSPPPSAHTHTHTRTSTSSRLPRSSPHQVTQHVKPDSFSSSLRNCVFHTRVCVRARARLCVCSQQVSCLDRHL